MFNVFVKPEVLVSAAMVTLVDTMVCALVDDTEKVSIELVEAGPQMVLNIRVADADLGKIIGKHGRTARSLRTIVANASTKLHQRFELNIVGKEGQAVRNA